MRDKRTLDLRGAEAMAGDVQHVIDSADNPKIAILIASCAITG